jgi:hypothetical protein
MKLVSDWKDFWKWHSTQIMLVFALIPAAWEQIPDDLKQSVPEEWKPWIAAVMFVVWLLGRLRAQE